MPLRLFTLNIEIIRKRFRNRLLEWFLAVVMTVGGVRLLTSGETFQLEPYELLGRIAVEQTWAWLMLGVGAVRIVVLGVNGSLKRGSPEARALMAFLAGNIWLALYIGFQSFQTPLLITTFLGPAVLAEFVNTFRAARDAYDEACTRGGSDADGFPR